MVLADSQRAYLGGRHTKTYRGDSPSGQGPPMHPERWRLRRADWLGDEISRSG